MNASILAALLALAPQPALSNIRVHDGDTIKADVVLGFGLVWHDRDIRVAGFDAWESNRARRTVKVTAGEIEKGKLATAALEQLLGSAKRVSVLESSGPRDPHGRVLLWVFADGKEIGATMRAAGHERN